MSSFIGSVSRNPQCATAVVAQSKMYSIISYTAQDTKVDFFTIVRKGRKEVSCIQVLPRGGALSRLWWPWKCVDWP
jgi:hypothetical protein